VTNACQENTGLTGRLFIAFFKPVWLMLRMISIVLVFLRQSDLANHKCSVVLVSFGALEGAKRWLQETGFSFPLYLDSDRKIYSAFGLPRSIAMV